MKKKNHILYAMDQIVMVLMLVHVWFQLMLNSSQFAMGLTVQLKLEHALLQDLLNSQSAMDQTVQLKQEHALLQHLLNSQSAMDQTVQLKLEHALLQDLLNSQSAMDQTVQLKLEHALLQDLLNSQSAMDLKEPLKQEHALLQDLLNFQFAMDKMVVKKKEHADKTYHRLHLLKLESHSSQLLLHLPDLFQFATVTMAQTESTALDQSAMELMDHLMDGVEPHAQERSQLLFHITKPTHLPEDHIKPLVIFLSPAQELPQPTLLVLQPETPKVDYHQWHQDQDDRPDQIRILFKFKA